MLRRFSLQEDLKKARHKTGCIAPYNSLGYRRFLKIFKIQRDLFLLQRVPLCRCRLVDEPLTKHCILFGRFGELRHGFSAASSARSGIWSVLRILSLLVLQFQKRQQALFLTSN